MGFLGSLFGGLGSALSGAMGSLGSLGSGLMNMFGGGAGLGSLGSLLGGGGSKPPATSGYSQPNGYGQLSKQSLMGSPYQMNVPKSSGSSFMNSMFPGGSTQGILGMMAPLLGDLFAPKKNKMPDINSLGSVQALRNFRPGNSVSTQYQSMLKHNTDQLREQKVRELQALYHNARPGTDYLTDSNYQRDLASLDKGVQDNLTDELAKAEGTFSSQEQERLSEIAKMDVYSIMMQTGLDSQEAQQFKDMFSNVGNMFLTNATRNPMSYFGGN